MALALATTVAAAACGIAPGDGASTATHVSWTLVSQAGAKASGWLQGVTCVTADDCWAVGYTQGPTIIDQDRSGVWATVASPRQGLVDSELQSVACATATACWAVAAAPGPAAIERYTGGPWVLDPAAAHLDLLASGLYGVACPASGACWAVGSSPFGALIENDNSGAWTTVEGGSRPASGYQEQFLSGVSCADPSDCWAVGGYDETDGDTVTFVEQDQGGAWLPVPSPNPTGSVLATLDAVACVSSSECWAVGSYQYAGQYAAGTSEPLIERWADGTWSVVSGPTLSDSAGGKLNGVACQQPDVCWAVGDAGSGDLVEEYAGGSWSVVPAAAGTMAHAELNAVTCAPGGRCWAAGSASDGPDSWHTLIEHT